MNNQELTVARPCIQPNPCNGVDVGSYVARKCPDRRTAYTGVCGGVGAAAYNIKNADTTAPAAPTGLSIQ